MSDKTNMPAATDGSFIRTVDVASDTNDAGALGGKGRSLVRLAALGLPTPRAFAVGPSLWNALRAAGPPLPERLVTLADLAALDAARQELLTTPLPETFDRELQRALDDVERCVSAPGAGAVTFSVRSSADTEDQAGALGAGLYASVLRVSRADVPGAIRQVLASFVTPAAWVYGAARARATGLDTRDAGGAVLIHAFVDGQAWGAAAGAIAAPETIDAHESGDYIRIDATEGTPTNAAREKITGAVRAAARAHGPSEIEWVAVQDDVTFLQLRAYRPVSHAISWTVASDDAADVAFAAAQNPAQPGGPWTWDAAHNPLPLSPAQAGLVELCDGLATLGFRQQVIHGYLFFRAVPAPPSPATDPRATFGALSADTMRRLQALGPEPALEDALELFVSAYEPLFGVVAATCAAARKSLIAFVGERFPDSLAQLPTLLGGVPSVAHLRRAAGDEIATASTAEARQAAVTSYLEQFGDESPRWDVAEPTLAETPDQLLLFAAAGRPTPGHRGVMANSYRAQGIARSLRSHLPRSERIPFDNLLTLARQAVAVGEDADALFARLQACVRGALLATGRRLVTAQRLDTVDDVFYLPLSVTRAPADSDDLRSLSAAGRHAFRAATASPPRMAATGGSQILRGRPGAGGRVIGRAVHHPPSVPLGPDAILIAATLLPTELPLLSPAAIVVETGHELGHVAAQARERGIPAVVGTPGAIASIPEQALIVVDGDRGEVVLLATD